MYAGSCKRWYFGADVAPHTVYTVKPQTLAEPENKQFRVSGTAAICFSVTSERRGFFSFSWLDWSSYGEWKWTKRGSRSSMIAGGVQGPSRCKQAACGRTGSTGCEVDARV